MIIRDGDWRLFDFDFATGRSTWLRYEPDGGKTFRIDYPVDGVLEVNLQARNDSDRRFGEWARVASVPHVVLQQSGLKEAFLQDDRQFISRFLNDSDNRAWRTKEGKV